MGRGGFRFRKSIKIAPGVRLNVGKKSIGLSAGVKGFRVSTNTRTGSRMSVGLPGTGLRYEQKLGPGKSGRRQEDNTKAENWLGYGALGVVVVIIFTFLTNSPEAAQSTSGSSTSALNVAGTQLSKVAFSSDPSGAQLFISGVRQGATPLTVNVPINRDLPYRLEAAEPYADYKLYKPFAGTLNVSKDEAVSVWIERTTAEEQSAQARAAQQARETLAEQERQRQAAEAERVRQQEATRRAAAPAAALTAPTSTRSGYTGGDMNCGDFSSHAQAQAFFESQGPGDPHDLDRDSDGLACESL